jgi:hypothetical protein
MAKRDPIRAFQRKAVAGRRAGESARCACGEARPEALVSGTNPIICAECRRRLKGQSPLDDHHIAGKANSPATIPIPSNDHRAILSTAQYDWPKTTLENPDGLELLKAAAAIRGFIDTHDYLINKILRPLPEVLEKLADLERKERTDQQP